MNVKIIQLAYSTWGRCSLFIPQLYINFGKKKVAGSMLM